MAKPASKLGTGGLNWMKPKSTGAEEQESDTTPLPIDARLAESESISIAEQKSNAVEEPKSEAISAPESVTTSTQKSTDTVAPKSTRAKEQKRKETVQEIIPQSVGAKIPKSKNPAWGKCSYYLESDILMRLQIHAARTRQDQSDIVNNAVKEWLDREGG